MFAHEVLPMFAHVYFAICKNTILWIARRTATFGQRIYHKTECSHHWQMTESAVALGSITEREGGGVGGGQADLQTARAFFCMFEGP